MASPAQAQRLDLPSIVAQFYPTSLDADLAAIGAGNTDVRRQCHVVLSSDARGGAAVILAAFTNSQNGVVRVLVRSGGTFAVADEASGVLLVGSSCRAEAIDVDGDGTPEAVVRFALRAGTTERVYAWRDGALADLSPLTADGQPIAVFNSEFVDLDGDGMLELRSRPRRAGATGDAGRDTVFRLSAGAYSSGR
jgi:hypothetical protein